MSPDQKQESRLALASFATYVIAVTVVILAALLAFVVLKMGPHGMRVKRYDSRSVATTAPLSRSDSPPSMCFEGNECYPDSTGPWDSICPSEVDGAPVLLKCKGGRLIKSE